MTGEKDETDRLRSQNIALFDSSFTENVNRH